MLQYYFCVLDSVNLTNMFAFCYLDFGSSNWYVGISPVVFICIKQLFIRRCLSRIPTIMLGGLSKQ
jgi:hypothetical protein